MTVLNIAKIMLFLGAIGIVLCSWRYSQNFPRNEIPFEGTGSLLFFGTMLFLWYRNRIDRDEADV